MRRPFDHMIRQTNQGHVARTRHYAVAGNFTWRLLC